ncbi:MAG: hypothetical protein E6G83_20420 [Alphaproteobacteria bacterium]|nr:MAG: hypothetical protein E6G83_20420 [Alphaproteobacteria bacterium]
MIVTAYVGATVFQVAPVFAASAATGSAAMNGMTHEEPGHSDKMPCKGMLPACITDIGCIFLVRPLFSRSAIPFRTPPARVAPALKLNGVKRQPARRP